MPRLFKARNERCAEKWVELGEMHFAEAAGWKRCSEVARGSGDVDHAESCLKKVAQFSDAATNAFRRARECRCGVDVYYPGEYVGW